MAANKTLPTNQSVDAYIAAIANETQRSDASKLTTIISKATHTAPVMWGSSIVGFGTYHYVYATGREGDTPAIGFAARKNALVIYGLLHYSENQTNVDLSKQLGIFTRGKGCVYIKQLADVDEAILAKMVKNAFLERQNTT